MVIKNISSGKPMITRLKMELARKISLKKYIESYTSTRN